MAYSLLERKLLSGSVNWLPAGDQIPDEDAQAMSNFKVDQAGRIVSRLGHTAVVSPGSSINRIHANGSNRYSGAGTALFRGGSSVTTGFDGNPLGLVGWKGYEWVMNRSKQGKDSGSAFSSWIPTAPVGAPTVTVNAILSTTLDNFEAASGWTPSTGLALTDDAVNVQQGTNSMKCSVATGGIYTATKNASLNLNSVGGQTGSDDDKFAVWIRCSDFTQLNGVRLLVDVSSSAGSFGDYYRAELQRKKIKQARGNWLHLEIKRTATGNTVDEGLSQTDILKDLILNAYSFERFGSTAGRDWSTVTSLRLEIDAAGPVDVWVDSWIVFGSAVGSIEGDDIGYYYTYTTTDGIESNPSPESTLKTFNRQSAGVAVTASAEAQVSGINVYRTGGTLGNVYRINTTVYANTTATITDQHTDNDLTDLDLVMETDNDNPPAASGLIGPHFGRLIAFSSAANVNRFWWSKQNRFPFPGSASAVGNWADVGNSGEAILAMTQHNRVVHIYKTASIWRMVGDPDDSSGVVEPTRAKFGIVGAKAVCKAEGGDYIACPEGIYFFNGDTATKISQKIDPVFKGQTVTLASGVTISPISDKTTICMEYESGVLTVSYDNTASVVYDVESHRWGQDSRGWSALYYDGSVLYGGTSAGAILQLKSGTTDAGSSIAVIYQSRYEDCGLPDAQKTFEDFEIECDRGGATLTVTAYLDNGGSNVALGTISTGSGRTKYKLQFNTGAGQKATNVSIRVTGSTSTGITIFGLWLHYFPEARAGRSFDTDEQDFNLKGVKLIRQWEMDLDNAGTVNLNILSDLPGNAMASRETPTVAAGTTRRVVAKMLASQYKGYLHRLNLSSSADLSLYGLRAEVKPLGDYVVAAEIWNSDELTFGSNKVKGARAIKIDLENSATVTVRVYSDLPGGTLALRDTVSITSTGVRRVLEIPLGAEREGYLFEVTATSTADWVIYSLEVETREIGEYIAAGSGKIYDSGILNLETERVKLFREIELDLRSAATVTGTFLTDLSGGTVTSRLSSTIATTSSNRKTVKIRVPGTVKGRLFQWTGSSSADFVLYAARLFVKMIGEPNATPWHWVEFPVTRTAQGVWAWASAPVEKTESNGWRWVELPVDQIRAAA
jgi:hypothetical protein